MSILWRGIRNKMNEHLNIILWLIPFCGFIQLCLLLDNLSVFQKDLNKTLPDTSESSAYNSLKVSILLPARDEEDNIESCLSSLRKQSHQNIEIIVLDDSSKDNTKTIVEQIVEDDTRCQLLEGTPTPEGFTGKNHACQQLAQKASGDWLLFVDADTALAQDAVSRALLIAKEENAQLICLWPRQIMESTAEAFMIPLLSFILLGFLPMRFAESSPWHIFTAANGQFMFFDKKYYEKCGGHHSLKNEIMDDVRLAQLIKLARGKVVVRDAGKRASCRMYNSFKSIWLGFRKNIYAAFNGRTWIFTLSIFALFLGHSAPLFLAVAGYCLGNESLFIPMLVQVIIGIVMRLILALKLDHSYTSSLAHHLAVSATVALAIDSFIGYNGQGVSWKGRTYRRTK